MDCCSIQSNGYALPFKIIRQGPCHIILILAAVMLVSVQCLGWWWEGLLGQLCCTSLPYCDFFKNKWNIEFLILVGSGSGYLQMHCGILEWICGFGSCLLDSHCSGSGAKSISFLHFLVHHCSISNILYNKTFVCSVISLYAKVIHVDEIVPGYLSCIPHHITWSICRKYSIGVGCHDDWWFSITISDDWPQFVPKFASSSLTNFHLVNLFAD
jgi:hypothetical protein